MCVPGDVCVPGGVCVTGDVCVCQVMSLAENGS